MSKEKRTQYRKKHKHEKTHSTIDDETNMHIN